MELAQPVLGPESRMLTVDGHGWLFDDWMNQGKYLPKSWSGNFWPQIIWTMSTLQLGRSLIRGLAWYVLFLMPWWGGGRSIDLPLQQNDSYFYYWVWSPAGKSESLIESCEMEIQTGWPSWPDTWDWIRRQGGSHVILQHSIS